MPRKVKDLIWVTPADNPWPPTRPRGSKGAGLRYQRKVTLHTGGIGGKWYKFLDANGVGFCSPDVLLPQQKLLLVLEVKLTDTPQAQEQLLDLYIPVLRQLWPGPIRGIVVAKSLTPASHSVCRSLREAITHPAPAPVLHWLGQGRFPW